MIDLDNDMPTSGACASLGCCEGVFLNHGKDPAIIHHCCLLCTARLFCVTEFTSAFFSPIRMYQTVDLATPNVLDISLMECLLFLQPKDGPFHLH